MDVQQNADNIENIKVTGVTWKQLMTAVLVLCGGIMTVEATVLGIYFGLKTQVITNSARLDAQEKEIVNHAVDINVIKTHEAVTDETIRNLKPQNLISYGGISKR